MKNFIELKEINTQHAQNLWDTVRTVLRGKFIALCDYIKKKTGEMSSKKNQKQTKQNLTAYLKALELKL